MRGRMPFGASTLTLGSLVPLGDIFLELPWMCSGEISTQDFFAIEQKRLHSFDEGCKQDACTQHPMSPAARTS